MTLDEFCRRLSTLEGYTATQYAEAMLWFVDHQKSGAEKTQGELARIIHEHGLGKPSSTTLGQNLARSKRTIRGRSGFKLRASARDVIANELDAILEALPAQVDTRAGYLPEAVWRDTRGYIESVCWELNGCVQFGFCNAAAVLIRRITETLIIEAYTAAGREAEIQDNDGHYFMLSGLISAAKTGLGMGRDAKKSLNSIKTLGDRSAHNPRFNATHGDLEKLEDGVRVVADELIAIAGLRRS